MIELFNLPPERVSAAWSRSAWDWTTLPEVLRATVKKSPDSPAIQTGSVSLSRAELRAMASRVAGGLVELGVGAGDVVLYQLPTSVDAVILQFAIAELGAVASPVSPMHREQDLGHMVALAQPKVIVTRPEYRGVRFAELHRTVLSDLGQESHVVEVPGGSVVSVLGGPVPRVSPRRDANEPLYIVWTSGTSGGHPKGVVHTHNTGLCGLARYLERLAVDSRDAMLTVTPIAHHIGIYAMHMVALGVRVVLLQSWDPEHARQLTAARRPTFSSLTPTFVYDLLDSAEVSTGDISSLRMTNVSGAPVPASLIERAHDVLPDCRLLAAYGASEEGYISSVGPRDPPTMSAVSTGRALRDIEVRVVDEDRIDEGPGIEGDILVRTPSALAGYLAARELTEDAFPEPNWRATGDRGAINGDGTIRIVGRKKDQIIRGGVNVPVAQVEDTMLRHPDIAAVALVAMPDRRMGEKGCAFVVPRGKANPELDEITAFLRAEGVAPPYLPERLEVVDGLPLTATGKVQKFSLRDRAARYADSRE